MRRTELALVIHLGGGGGLEEVGLGEEWVREADGWGVLAGSCVLGADFSIGILTS